MGQGGRGAQGGQDSRGGLEEPAVEQCGDWTGLFWVLPFRGGSSGTQFVSHSCPLSGLNVPGWGSVDTSQAGTLTWGMIAP